MLLATIAIVSSCATACSQDVKPTKYVVITYPREGEIQQCWVVPNRTGLSLQSIADHHLPAPYSFDLDVARLPKVLGLKSLTIDELAQFQHIVTLDLAGTDISDADLAKLTKLPRLETLVLDHTDVSGTGLKQLTKCSALKVLSLHGLAKMDETITTAEKNRNAQIAVELAPASYFLEEALPGLVLVVGAGDTLVSVHKRR